MSEEKVTVYFKCKVCKKTRDMLVPPEREQLWLDRIENGQQIICYACPNLQRLIILKKRELKDITNGMADMIGITRKPK